MPNQSISPLTRQARRDDERDDRDDGRTTERTTNGRTRRKRTSLTRRQASNETHDETTNETRGETETTRKKASSSGEGMRTRRTKRPHFLTSRPTPSRLFSFIRRSQLFPRPRAWDERAAKQAHPARRLIHCLGGSHHSRPASSALARRIFSSLASSFRTRRSR